jgi:hypothetical protein
MSRILIWELFSDVNMAIFVFILDVSYSFGLLDGLTNRVGGYICEEFLSGVKAEFFFDLFVDVLHFPVPGSVVANCQWRHVEMVSQVDDLHFFEVVIHDGQSANEEGVELNGLKLAVGTVHNGLELAEHVIDHH